eukprot:gene6700-7792_t
MSLKSLTIAQFILKGIKNTRGSRNASLKRSIKELQDEVKKNPTEYLVKPQVVKYKSWMNSTKSIVVENGLVPDGGSEPAAPILVRLITDKGSLPTISNVVDCMNYISVKYGVAISIWDLDSVNQQQQEAGLIVQYQYSLGGEKYWPFMAEEELELLPGELIGVHDKKLHIQGVDCDPTDLSTIDTARTELQSLLQESVGGGLENSITITNDTV